MFARQIWVKWILHVYILQQIQVYPRFPLQTPSHSNLLNDTIAYFNLLVHSLSYCCLLDSNLSNASFLLHLLMCILAFLPSLAFTKLSSPTCKNIPFCTYTFFRSLSSCWLQCSFSSLNLKPSDLSSSIFFVSASFVPSVPAFKFSRILRHRVYKNTSLKTFLNCLY